ncbi:MAG: amidohydrolase [Beijerinckiaceae bacterium]|nr:amidohydrolase [Beijerinckiaceae bacterium]MCZ8299228.1 amidohydrolase [Beijerinckiaceae bacterium]
MTGGTLLIRQAMILTLDAGDRIFDCCDILIRDGVIEAVGMVPAEANAMADRVIEARGMLAVPGLVNAHMHSQSGTMAGFGDRLSHPAFMWLTQAHTSRRTPEEIRLAVLLCAAQMLQSGTTAAIDHFPGQRFTLAEMDAVLTAWAETGMRVTLGMRFFDGAFSDIVPAGAGLPPELSAAAASVDILQPHPLAALREEMPDIIRRWHGHAGRIGVFPAPSNPDRCSDEALVFCAELAEQHDLGIHTHLLETRAQAEIAARRYGTTTVEHLDRLGVLSGRWSCAHCIWLNDDDIARMARHGVVAVHNPESNARIGAGRMRTPDLLAAGVPIALGTDGSGANDNLILQEAMRAAALLHRADLPDRARWVSARDALRMATEGGAKALRRDGEIGVLAPGFRADLALYRLDHPWWVPVNDPVAQMVFAETGAAVSHVLVDGHLLVEDGKIIAFDAAGALAEISDRIDSMKRRNADLFAMAEAIARAVP